MGQIGRADMRVVRRERRRHRGAVATHAFALASLLAVPLVVYRVPYPLSLLVAMPLLLAAGWLLLMRKQL